MTLLHESWDSYPSRVTGLWEHRATCDVCGHNAVEHATGTEQKASEQFAGFNLCGHCGQLDNITGGEFTEHLYAVEA